MEAAEQRVLVHHQPVATVIDHPGLAGAGYFFDAHTLAIIVFIAKTEFGRDRASTTRSEAPAVGLQPLDGIWWDDKTEVVQVVVDVEGVQPTRWTRTRRVPSLYFS